jgi:YggT family protein
MSAIVEILIIFLQLYFFILLARVLISWVRVDPYHPVARFLYAVTDPILDPIKAILPQTGMIDFSPVVAVLIIMILQTILSKLR